MFCNKCGKEVLDNSLHCNYCGEAIGQKKETNRQMTMYTKEEYLTISEEYSKEKKEIEEKYKKKIAICCISMAVSFVLCFVFLCMMIINPMLGVISIICIATGIASAVCWQLNINKRKALLEELADTHYRKYINNYNKIK